MHLGITIRCVLCTSLLLGAAGTVQAQSRARARAIRAEMASVLLQSRRYDEAAREYRVLLADEPRNTSHRLNLARSLMWGGRPREAEREIIVLMSQRGRDPSLESMLLSARLQLRPSSAEAAGWLRERPQLLEYRRIHARALAREGRTAAALAQFDTLIQLRPSAAHFLERAYVHAERRDIAAAERDLNASLQLGPTGDAWILLGDLHRSRANYSAARNAYWQARRISTDVDLAAAMGRLARDERPVVGLLPDVAGDAPGWHGITSTAGDNLGVSLTTTTLRRGTRRLSGFDASVGATARWLTAPSASPVSGPAAAGADVALSREGSRGRWHARGRARAGLLQHSRGGTQPEGGVAAVLFRDAWGVGFDLSAGPAYPDLLTVDAFLPSPVTGDQLREQSSTLSLAGPLGKVDVGGSWQSSALSDGNTRSTLLAMARLPVSEHVALVYSGSSMSFDQATPLYWSPERYVAHGAGPELSLRRARGWSASLRVLPGGAWTVDRSDSTAAPGTNTSAFQLTVGSGLSYRSTTWEVGGGASYGRGRGGDYERFDAALYVRLAP